MARHAVALALVLAVAALEATVGGAAHVSSPFQSAATPGATVQKELDAAIAKGAKAFTLPKGNVIFNSTDFLVAGAKDMVIQGFYSTQLWFNTGAGVRLDSCSHVTLSTLAINYWVLPYVQGTVVSSKAASGGNSTYHLKLAQRSAKPDTIIPKLNLANGGAVWKVAKGMTNEAKISSMISTCATPPPSGPFPTGTAPCPLLSYTSVGTSLTVTLPTITPAPAAGDMMTFKASVGHTYVVANCTGIVTNLLTIHAAGWMAVYEVDGLGGNTFKSLRIEPDDGYLIGSNADAFHSTDVATGPTLTGSTFKNILNDFFSTHSTIHVLGVLPPTSGAMVLAQPRAWAFGSPAGSLTDEFYGTASPMSNVIPGKDTLTCYEMNSFALLGTATITEAAAIKNESMLAEASAMPERADSSKSAVPAIQTWDSVALWSIKLSTEIPGSASGKCCQLCTIDRFGGKGVSITHNKFTNGAALLGRTKSTGAEISDNTWDNTATHTLEVTALQPFMEGPVEISNVSVTNNIFIDSTTNGTSPLAPGPNTTHVTFKGNKITPPK
jgi:hypothetical protein